MQQSPNDDDGDDDIEGGRAVATNLQQQQQQQQPFFPPPPLSLSRNWFSLKNSLNVYRWYLSLDKDQNGMIFKRS